MLFGGLASVSVAGRSHTGRWQEPGGPGLAGIHAPGPHMASDVTAWCCHATSGDTRPFTSGPTVTRPSPWLQARALVSTSDPDGSGPRPASDLATESRCSHLGMFWLTQHVPPAAGSPTHGEGVGLTSAPSQQQIQTVLPLHHTSRKESWVAPPGLGVQHSPPPPCFTFDNCRTHA